MQVIENLKVKEKVYIEKLENGLTVMIVPKKGIQKKYIIWGTNYGSNDSKFIVPGEKEVTEVPDGVAHYLEHKMFEQRTGKNSLDVLTALGVNANAYTTNNHTAYLYECTDKFYDALDEFMDYVQNPYFTDENVEKEKGIIGQEIMMYNDYPEWKVYINALQAMYHENPIKIDTAGTIESIAPIDKEILYKCYNTFYNPSNMAMVICGDFEPKEILKEVKKRIIKNEANGEIKRVYPEEPETIVKPKIEQKMDVSTPLYVIGIKDKGAEQNEIVKKHIALEILFNIIFGQSSKLYKKLYDDGTIFSSQSLEYDFAKGYAHILCSGQAKDPEKVFKELKDELQRLKKNGINEEDFNRSKKMIYGTYVKEYDDVQNIARMFLSDYFKGINSFDYLEEIESVNLEYATQILNEVFCDDKMVLSVVRK